MCYYLELMGVLVLGVLGEHPLLLSTNVDNNISKKFLKDSKNVDAINK